MTNRPQQPRKPLNNRAFCLKTAHICLAFWPDGRNPADRKKEAAFETERSAAEGSSAQGWRRLLLVLSLLARRVASQWAGSDHARGAPNRSRPRRGSSDPK